MDDSIAIGMSRQMATHMVTGLEVVGLAYRNGLVVMPDESVQALYDLHVALNAYINDNEEEASRG